MLRVEKSKADKQISIRLNQPQKRWDRYFIFSFLFALFIHLSAAFLFHVHLFTFGMIEDILPATKTTAPLIKSSSNEQDALVTSVANLEGRVTAYHLIPPLSEPNTKEIDQFISFKPQSHAPYFLSQLFSSYKDVPDKVLEPQITIPSLKLTVSGFLSDFPFEIPYFDKNLFENKQWNREFFKQTNLLYTVYVNSLTGQVFWFQSENTIRNNTQLTLAEEILKQIRFTTGILDPIITGQIEFSFTEETP